MEDIPSSSLLESPDRVIQRVSDDEAERIKGLLGKIGDLMLYVHPGSGISYCSKTMAQHMTKVFIAEQKISEGHVAYYAWPYTDVDGYVVYSNPPYVKIGETNLNGFGVLPTQNWNSILDEADLHYKAVRTIREWLDSKRPISYL